MEMDSKAGSFNRANMKKFPESESHFEGSSTCREKGTSLEPL